MRAVCSAVGPAADPELALGARDPELLDEDRRELVVVVLAGVDEVLLVLLAQEARDGRGLDELRPVSDDGDDLHARTAAAMTSRTRSATTLVSGPGAAARRTPSIACTGWTSRIVEARNASVANGSSSAEIERSATRPVSMHAPARDRVEHVVAERRRHEPLPVERADERLPRPLEHPSVRRDEQRLVRALLLRQARHEHVRGVRERLDRVEDPRRRIADGLQRDGRRDLLRRLQQRDAPPPARGHEPQVAVEPRLGGPQQPHRVRREQLRGQLQPQARRRPLHPLQVLIQRIRDPRVHPRHLKHAITPQQPLVKDRDRGIPRRHHNDHQASRAPTDPATPAGPRRAAGSAARAEDRGCLRPNGKWELCRQAPPHEAGRAQAPRDRRTTVPPLGIEPRTFGLRVRCSAN